MSNSNCSRCRREYSMKYVQEQRKDQGNKRRQHARTRQMRQNRIDFSISREYAV